MGTLSSEVNDLFMTLIRDYRLDAIYNTSGSFVFNTYLEPWLLFSIRDFNCCDQSLAYTISGSATEGYFTETLNTENKLMLARLMMKFWMEKTVQDVLQMQNFVTDRDFKTYSAAQNLKSKQDYLNSLKEELSQDLVDYAYQRNNWTNWKNQLFDL